MVHYLYCTITVVNSLLGSRVLIDCHQKKHFYSFLHACACTQSCTVHVTCLIRSFNKRHVIVQELEAHLGSPTVYVSEWKLRFPSLVIFFKHVHCSLLWACRSAIYWTNTWPTAGVWLLGGQLAWNSLDTPMNNTIYQYPLLDWLILMPPTGWNPSSTQIMCFLLQVHRQVC